MARRLVTTRLAQRGLDHLIDQVALVVSGYTTNAVRATGPDEAPQGYAELHAATPPMLTVRLRLTASHLIAEVGDVSQAPPVPRAAGELDEDGRGLTLVRAAADHVGYRLSAEGKIVWAAWRLDAASAPQRPEALNA
ncbi:hypothetical protein GCM10027589_24120 [Actinocorallia lasiicapitis]